MIKMVPSIFGKVYTTEELIQLRDELNELLVSEVTASVDHKEHVKTHIEVAERILKDQIEKWFVENPKYQIDFTPEQLDQLSQFFIDEKIDFEKFKGYCVNESCVTYESIFSYAFIWNSTQEGCDYWLDIDNKWKRICK